MKEKTFHRIVTAIVVLGMLMTAALIAYTLYLRSNCSIIAFIANGR